MNRAIEIQKANAINPNRTLVKRTDSATGSPVQQIYRNIAQAEVPEPFSLTFDNSGGGAVAQYVIGDPSSIIAKAFGITTKVADSGTVDPASLNFTFAATPVIIGEINYEVTNSAAQFSQPFEIANANIGGKSSKNAVNMAAVVRNNQFNSKLLTFKTNVVLNQTNCMFLKVAAGEVVTMTFTPEATVNG